MLTTLYANAFPLLNPAGLLPSPDRKNIAVLSRAEGTAAALFDASALELLATCPFGLDTSDSISDACFDYKGGTLFIAYGNYDGGFMYSGNVIAWDVHSGYAQSLFRHAPKALRCRVRDGVLDVLFTPSLDSDPYFHRASINIAAWDAMNPIDLEPILRQVGARRNVERSSSLMLYQQDLVRYLVRNGKIDILVTCDPPDILEVPPQEHFDLNVSDTDDFTSKVIDKSFLQPIVSLFIPPCDDFCSAVSTVFHRAAEEDLDSWKVATVDATAVPNLCQQLGIVRYPTVAVFNQGKIFGQIAWPRIESVRAAIRRSLSWGAGIQGASGPR